MSSDGDGASVYRPDAGSTFLVGDTRTGVGVGVGGEPVVLIFLDGKWSSGAADRLTLMLRKDNARNVGRAMIDAADHGPGDVA